MKPSRFTENQIIRILKEAEAEVPLVIIAEEWLEGHNAIRPHEALGGLSPCQDGAPADH